MKGKHTVNLTDVGTLTADEIVSVELKPGGFLCALSCHFRSEALLTFSVLQNQRVSFVSIL